MVRIYNILTTLFGESKQGYFDKSCSQYQFNSPWATEDNNGVPDGKFNLEVSMSMGKYHEWVTDKGGNLSRLIKRFGGQEFLQEYYSIIKDLKESRYYNIGLFADDGSSILSEASQIKLPETFKKIDLSTCRKQKLVDFLKSRCITQEIIEQYNIGYTAWEDPDRKFSNRIIIPSYDSVGDLNYFVGRSFDDKDKRPKYCNCKADKEEIVLHENLIQWNSTIYLVEGALDCLHYRNTISLLGKTLKKSSEVFRKLYEKANANIVICLDGDTTIDEVKRLYNVLNVGRLRGRIQYIRMGTNECPYKDFSEINENKGRNGLIDVFKTAKKFSEIELIF